MDGQEVSGEVLDQQFSTDSQGNQRKVSPTWQGNTSLANFSSAEAKYIESILSHYDRGTLALSNSRGWHARNECFSEVFHAVFDLQKAMGEGTYYYRRRVPAKVVSKMRLTNDKGEKVTIDNSYYTPFINPTMQKLGSEEEVMNVILREYQNFFPRTHHADELRGAYKTVCANIATRKDLGGVVKSVDNGLIGIGVEHLFDMNEGRLYKIEEWLIAHKMSDVRIYKHIFDTTYRVSKDQVIMPPITKEMAQTIYDSYTDMRYALAMEGKVDPETGEKGKGDPCDEPIINAWACNSRDVYKDIMSMYAIAFMAEKPTGIFFLIGEGRNGKSSCLDLLASIVGVNNMTSVPAESLGDKHQAIDLKNSMLNVPDESKIGKSRRGGKGGNDDDVIKVLKIAGDHGAIGSEKMYEQKSLRFRANFLLACPVNHIPDWNGSDASALLERTRPIPFLADFRGGADNSGKSWGEENFTVEFMLRITGKILAYAHHMTLHGWVPSQTMINERDSVELATSNIVSYVDSWKRWFRGYEHFDTIKQDYQWWCKQHDYEVESFDRKGAGGFAFFNKYGKESKLKHPILGERRRVYMARIESEANDMSKAIMYDDYRSRGGVTNSGSTDLMNGKTLKEYHLREQKSLVFALEEREEAKYGCSLEEHDRIAKELEAKAAERAVQEELF